MAEKKSPRGNTESLATGPWVPVFCEFRFVKMLKGPFLDFAVNRKRGDHCMERANSGEEGAACQGKIWTPRQAQTTERGIPYMLGTAVSRKDKGPQPHTAVTSSVVFLFRFFSSTVSTCLTPVQAAAM